MYNSSNIRFRRGDPSDDLTHVVRIWNEVGWFDVDKQEQQQFMEQFLRGSDLWIAEVDGIPECAVTTTPGSMRYLQSGLTMCAVTSVVAGLRIRKLGIASRLTALAVAHGALKGLEIAGLSCFDHGYYDRLGFGNGSYLRHLSFDPAHLKVDRRPSGVARALSSEHWKELHAARLNGPQGHGACFLTTPYHTRAGLMNAKEGYGLGFWDGERVSHGFWGNFLHDKQCFEVYLMIYTGIDELLELLWLLRSFSEQVNLVRMMEPPDIHIQDLLRAPLRAITVRETGEWAVRFSSYSYCQSRILDLVGCIERCPISGRGEVDFNLRLVDPIEDWLSADAGWGGLTGEYRVTLGERPRCSVGFEAGLPLLTASVNAFTRMWLGSATPRSLMLSDRFFAPAELLRRLGWLLLLPQPHPNWEF